jgi:hypothetical protein
MGQMHKGGNLKLDLLNSNSISFLFMSKPDAVVRTKLCPGNVGKCLFCYSKTQDTL